MKQSTAPRAPRKPNAKAETDLSKQTRDELTSRGYWCIRIQTGIIPASYATKGKKPRTHQRWIHCAENGTPDCMVIRRDGVIAFLEFKKPGQEPNADQLAWHARARRLGLHVALVEKISEAVTFVRDLPTPCAKVL